MRIGKTPKRGVYKGNKGKKTKKHAHFFPAFLQSTHEWEMRQTRFNLTRQPEELT